MLSDKGFDKWAGEYDESIARDSEGYPFEGYYNVLAYVQNKIKIEDGVKILDIGIGTGLLTQELYKKGARIYGIDFSKRGFFIVMILNLVYHKNWKMRNLIT